MCIYEHNNSGRNLRKALGFPLSESGLCCLVNSHFCSETYLSPGASDDSAEGMNRHGISALAHHGRKQFVPSECYTHAHTRTPLLDFTPEWQAGRRASVIYTESEYRPGPAEALRISGSFHPSALTEADSRLGLSVKGQVPPGLLSAIVLKPTRQNDGPGQPGQAQRWLWESQCRVAAQNLCDALLGAHGCL